MITTVFLERLQGNQVVLFRDCISVQCCRALFEGVLHAQSVESLVELCKAIHFLHRSSILKAKCAFGRHRPRDAIKQRTHARVTPNVSAETRAIA